MDKKTIEILFTIPILITGFFMLHQNKSLINTDSFSTKNLLLLLLLFAIAYSIYYIHSRKESFQNTLKNSKIIKTISTLTNWFDKTDDKTKEIIKNEYPKSDKNSCFGLLFNNEKRICSYLAFSDESDGSNSIGEKFSKFSDDIPYIYCQYSNDELKDIIPIGILDPELNPIETDELDQRQEKYQSCTERKIIKRFLDDYEDKLTTDTDNYFDLILFTKFQPCEFCQPLIRDMNQQYAKNLNIIVLHSDYLKSLVNDKKELLEICKEYEKPIQDIEKLLKLFPKTKEKKESEQTKASKLLKREEKEIKDLTKIAYAQCKVLNQCDVSKEVIKKALNCIIKSNGTGLSEDKINEIIEQIIEHKKIAS